MSTANLKKTEMPNLIGEFLNINSELVLSYKYYKPRFIGKLLERYYRGKLLKVVNKIPEMNFILTKDNLLEYFTHLYANNNVSYGCISKLEHIETTYLDLWQAKIYAQNCICLIKIDMSIPDTFELELTDVSNKSSYKYYTSYSKNLKPDRHDLLKFTNDINDLLLIDIKDYIYDTIKDFN